MIPKPATSLTAELSKAARRELRLTQSNVIAATGVQAYKLKQFEAGHFRPELGCLKQLTEFYEAHGVDFGLLAAHTGEGTQPSAVAPPTLHRNLTATPRPGFFIDDGIAQELVDRVLDRMEANDDRIVALLTAAYDKGIFGTTEATEAKVRELFAAMAESHLLFRFLQGRNVIGAIRDEPKTVGEFLSQWMQQSPAFDVVAPDAARAIAESEG